MQRGARPARPFTHFSKSFLLFLAPPASCRLAGWLVGWLAGWLAGWQAGWLAGWLVGWLAGWLVGWLAGWLLVGLTWKIGFDFAYSNDNI